MRLPDLANLAEAKAPTAARSTVPAVEHFFHEAVEVRDPTNHVSGRTPDLYESHPVNARPAVPISIATAAELKRRRLVSESASKSR